MPTVGGALSGFSTGTTPATVNISTIPDGAWMIATLFQEGSYATGPAPAGWTNLLPTNSQLSGTRGQAYAGRIKQPGDTAITWAPEFAAQSGGRRLAVLWGTGGAPVSQWARGPVGVRNATNVVSGQSVQAGTSTTSVAPPVTVAQADSLVVSIHSEATGAAGTFTITTTGVTQFYSSGEADVIQFIVAGHLTAGVGATAPITATAQQAQSANGQGLQIAIPPASIDPEPPEFVPFANVAQMLHTPGVTWAHRGGGAIWPEMTVYAYTQAAARGYGVLEVSFGRTSDGVWVGVHDNSLNRTSQTTGLPSINSMTWAQVQTYQVLIGTTGAPQPYARWEDIRDAFGDTHLLVLDPKNYNWGAHQAAFLDLCDELGPERVIVKQYASDVSLATAARARGFTTWGHTFDDFMDSPSLPDYLAAWDMLGIEIGASQANWDVLLGTGKPVMGHIAQSQADYDTAMAKGAFGVQCGRPDLIEAVNASSSPSLGSAAGAWQTIGAAIGTAPDVPMVTGAAAGTWSTTGAAVGAAPEVDAATGSASGSLSWSGSATGSTVRRGTAAGATGWAGTAQGARTAVATANGSTTWAGVAVGRSTRRGTASGSTGWAGAATGHAPSVDSRSGTAAGDTAWAGDGVGHRHPKAAAAGAVQWAGSAQGGTARAGAADGMTTWAGAAQGRGTGPSDDRDITITLSRLRPARTIRLSGLRPSSTPALGLLRRMT